jgi:molybdenum cofactor cytidylyltransferase
LHIVGVLLAAGRGERFGGDKLLAPLPDSTPIGVAACRQLVAALPDTIAVVRPGDVRLAELLRDCGARTLECPLAASGMGHSLACAINASRDAAGWVVALADMPWVRASTIATLADALREGAPMAAPAFNGRRGNPVGFSSAYADVLANLEGDRGARDLVARAAGLLRVLDVDDDGVLRDVDRAADVDAAGGKG